VMATIAVHQPDLFAADPDAHASPGTVNGERTDARPQRDVPKAPVPEGDGRG
jgi:hypothetical protein